MSSLPDKRLGVNAIAFAFAKSNNSPSYFLHFLLELMGGIEPTTTNKESEIGVYSSFHDFV